MSTVCEPLTIDAEWRDPNIVKVVRDQQGRALYFSRAPIPHVREHGDRPAATDWRFRHVGLYAYRVAYLQRFVALPPSELEALERLEQLRALAVGARIAVAIAAAPCGIGIDTPHDLERFTVQLTHLAAH
jgi:3-deoxy-manno-octulosonate cytidylyltransferase (CMP-KDO synthetase)